MDALFYYRHLSSSINKFLHLITINVPDKIETDISADVLPEPNNFI